jgi:serine/threonine protein kinase
MDNIKQGLVEKSEKHTYKYVRKLGAGYFNHTWLATIDDTEEKVVIKVYKVNELAINLMNKELNSLLYISKFEECKKYSVSYIDHYTIESHKFIFPFKQKVVNARLVMNYINGRTLTQDIELNNINKNNTKLLYDLIIGLDILHAHGIAHQNINVNNIMYDEDTGVYKYINWGLGCLKSLCINDEKCLKPCGFISHSYYNGAPELENIYKILNDDTNNDNLHKAYTETYFIDNILSDIWLLGITLIVYNKGEQIYSFSTKEQKYIYNYISVNISNQIIKGVIRFLLQKDNYNRALYWKPIVRLLQKYSVNLINV